MSRAGLRSFDLLARFYEAASWLYSAGQIQRAKAAQLPLVASGTSVLYLGVGAGEDAVQAARRGARVTCVDLSAAMLDRLAAKLARENLAATLIHGDAFAHQSPAGYDVVAANFFLNMFVESDMVRMLRHAATLVRPGGRLLIADVAPPLRPSLAARAVYHAYLDPGKLLACAAGLLRWHPNYDYRDYLAGTGLSVESVAWFRPLGLGPIAFQNLVLARRL